MRLLLSNPKGAFLRGVHARAKGVITNDDVLQKAWLARFGTMAGAHLTDAVSDRLGEGLAPGAHATLSGQSLDLSRTDDAKALADVIAGFAQRFGESGGPASNDDDPFARYRPGGGRDSPAGAASSPGQSMTSRELLLGSSFHVAGPGDGPGPELAAWGRVAHGHFEGEEPSDAGRLAIDGEVLTGTLGADADWGRMLAGVAVSLSEGDGTFDDSGATRGARGKIASSMTTVSPYPRFKLTTRGCAVAHSVRSITRAGTIDYLVATPLRLWVIETGHDDAPREQFPDVLRQVAEHTSAVWQWAPPGTPIRGCLVLAQGAMPGRRTCDYGTGPVVVHTPASLARELEAEASQERMIDERVAADVWEPGGVTK